MSHSVTLQRSDNKAGDGAEEGPEAEEEEEEFSSAREEGGGASKKEGGPVIPWGTWSVGEPALGEQKQRSEKGGCLQTAAWGARSRDGGQ